MKQEKVFLLLVVTTVVLSITLFTGVGYAAENGMQISNNVLLSPEQHDFKVAFEGKPTYYGTGKADLKITGQTTAKMNIKELKTIGDFVTVKFDVCNKSKNIYADMSVDIINTNTEYFNVVAEFTKSEVEPKKGITTLEITVQLIKLPIEKEEKADININILAHPIY